jgi:protease-4
MSESSFESPSQHPTPAPAPNRSPRADRPARGLFFGCLFGLSLLGNFLALAALGLVCVGLALRQSGDDFRHFPETFHSGTRTATSKVAVVAVEGLLLEGLVSSAHKQIEQAAHDDRVKAVVLLVNSPGGSITASEELHHRLVRLRDGDPDHKLDGKPLVVSMGSVAASGGYYISVPGRKIFAEPTTMTGSIGVYASLPDLRKLGEKYGVSVRTIKAGEIKNAGSMFAEMTPKERQVFQDMVNESYIQFLDVISTDRKHLTRAVLLKRFNVQPLRPDPQADDQAAPPVPYTRYRADGGAFSTREAKELGLIDAVGTLDDAIKEAVKLAQLDSWKAIKYHKTLSLPELLLGQTTAPVPAGTASLGLLDPDRLQHALTPRLWYLAPGHEAAAFAAAAQAARSRD